MFLRRIPPVLQRRLHSPATSRCLTIRRIAFSSSSSSSSSRSGSGSSGSEPTSSPSFPYNPFTKTQGHIQDQASKKKANLVERELIKAQIEQTKLTSLIKEAQDTANKPVALSVRLNRASIALPFPSFSAYNLRDAPNATGQEGLVNLGQLVKPSDPNGMTFVGLGFSASGSDANNTWMQRIKERYPGASEAQTGVQLEGPQVKRANVHITFSWWVKFVKGGLYTNLKAAVAPGELENNYVIYEDPALQRRALRASNPLCNYLYLVDRAGKVRAVASGWCTGDDEFEQLSSLIDGLHREQLAPPEQVRKTKGSQQPQGGKAQRATRKVKVRTTTQNTPANE